MLELGRSFVEWCAGQPWWLGAIVKYAIIGLGFAMPLAALLTWMERRQSAYAQDRLGPQRASFFSIGGREFRALGLLHILADSLKMFFKEPFVPATADGPVFRMAPMVGFVTTMVILSLIPFAPDIATAAGNIPMQVARVDAGILFAFAVGSLGVYGAAMAGWSSNNRFALLGGLRASAQTISYEIALGLTAVGILMASGSTELSAIVGSQGGVTTWGLPNWGIFLQPIGAILFLTAAMAETKRVPFDLPEGESEIIGYFVEYSSMAFGLFMLGEFLEVVTLAAVFVTLFLGGWQLPWIIGESSVNLFGWVSEEPWLITVVGMAVFGLKVFLMCVIQLQIRWTLPRFRYDQLMSLGWKSLLPLALLNIFVTALLIWWDPTLAYLRYFGFGVIGVFALVVIAGPKRAPVAAAHGH